MQRFLDSWFFTRGTQKGQAFLVVVLIMVIALTVGLSVASRTVTNLKMGSEEANSQKAFSAAEAGIEQTLQAAVGNSIVNQNFTTNNGSQIISLTRIYVGGSSNKALLNDGNAVVKDEGMDIWFTQYNSDPTQLYATFWPPGGGNGTFKIYWGDYGTLMASDPCTVAAIELIVITYTGATNWRADPTNLKFARYPVESGCSGRSNGFASPGVGTINFNGQQGMNFQYGTSFSLNHVIFARVIPLFYNTKIGVQITTAGLNFPLTGQGQLITSEGQAGSTQRQLTYFETWDTLPSEFLFSILKSQ